MSAHAYKLGTHLRHLIELLDGELDRLYADAVPGYRARYTPVIRALIVHEPGTIRQIADHAGITHSAASQTVAKMIADGLLLAAVGEDARERQVRLSKTMRALLPTLQAIWDATTRATTALDAELPASLADIVVSAVDALETRGLKARIEDELAASASEMQE
ncbi:MAG: helix-turn-helix domain-containing protein [Pseudomonadota bacterium]